MMRLLKISLATTFLFIFLTLSCINSFSAEAGTSMQQEQNASGGANELHSFYPAFIKYSPAIEKFIDGCDSISFAWSRLYQDDLTKLGTVKADHGNYGFYYPKDYLLPVLYAKSRGKPIQLSIYADSACSNSVLPYKDKRFQVIHTIMEILNKDISGGQSVYYDGVVIDFESLRDVDKNGNDILYNGQHISYYFNVFLSELKAELDKSGKRMYVAVNPRLYFNGYDYAGIVKIADKMIIMAHDYQPAGKLKKSDVKQYTGYDALTPIDSPAPINKIRMALEDVEKSVSDPSDRKKVMLQICFDCKQWRFSAPNMEEWEALDSLNLSNEHSCNETK